MARTEGGLRQRIRTAIRRGWPSALVVGQPANGMTGPGRHDLYVLVAGTYVGLEVKAPGHRTEARRLLIQTNRIRETRRAGGSAWFVCSVQSALVAVRLAERRYPMPDDAFDLDKLLDSFRPEDLAPSGTPVDVTPSAAALPLEELPSFDMPEQAIADRALSNGTAAGDGTALGELETPEEFLGRAILDLTHQVRILTEELRLVRAGQSPKQDEAPELGLPEASVVDDADAPASMSDLLASLDQTVAGTGPQPAATPARRSRKKPA